MTLDIKVDLLNMLERYSRYGWTQEAICKQWGISIKTFYTIRTSLSAPSPPRRIQLNKITDEERKAVVEYALEHTELRHREMAYRMIDEDVACVSPSSAYRILRDYSLLSTREQKDKSSYWFPHEAVAQPDQMWQTDLMYIVYKGREYYLLSYMDVYSRFIVYHKLCLSMTGTTIRDATSEALYYTEKKPVIIQSDNGSCYASQEYRSLMTFLKITHQFIHPHCPNENAEIERYHRTVRELVDVSDAESYTELLDIIKDQIDYYNYKRYHSKIGYVPPYARYVGSDTEILESRKRKLERAKKQRMQSNYEKYIQNTNAVQLTTVED